MFWDGEFWVPEAGPTKHRPPPAGRRRSRYSLATLPILFLIAALLVLIAATQTDLHKTTIGRATPTAAGGAMRGTTAPARSRTSIPSVSVFEPKGRTSNPSPGPASSISPIATPIPTATLAPAPTPGPGAVLNVRAYGAKGLGGDDTAAFLSAFRAAKPGDVVYVPAGTYRCNVSLASLSGVRFHGDGPASILEPFHLTKPILALGGAIANVEIDHLAFDGLRQKGATGSTLLLRGATDIRIHDNRFTGAPFRAVDFNISGGYTGYELSGGARNGQAWIERNTFTDGGADAIYVGDVDAFWVRDNVIDGAPDTGIDGGDRAQDGVISGNVIRHANVGILMSDFGSNIAITGNTLTGITGGGIHVTAGSFKGHSYTVKDNVIDPQGTGWGIATAAPGGVISGNVIRNAGYAGILINVGSGGLFTGNVIEDPVNSGFHVDTSGVTVRANKFPPATTVRTGTGLSVVVT